jgi:hypothetical protein
VHWWHRSQAAAVSAIQLARTMAIALAATPALYLVVPIVWRGRPRFQRPIARLLSYSPVSGLPVSSLGGRGTHHVWVWDRAGFFPAHPSNRPRVRQRPQTGKTLPGLATTFKTVCEAIVPVASNALIFSARWHSAHLANRLTPVLKQGSSLHPQAPLARREPGSAYREAVAAKAFPELVDSDPAQAGELTACRRMTQLTRCRLKGGNR